MSTTDMRQESGKLLLWKTTDSPFFADITNAEDCDLPTDAEILDRLLCYLLDEGLDPVTQLAGYVTSEDPTYLPEDPELRTLVRRMGRDKLLAALVQGYVDTHPDIQPQV